MFIILFIIHYVFLPNKKFSIPKGLYRYKNSHLEGFRLFKCSINKVIAKNSNNFVAFIFKKCKKFCCAIPTSHLGHTAKYLLNPSAWGYLTPS